jgi:hypothetical protein
MALTTITFVQREDVDASHDINTLNVRTPLPAPQRQPASVATRSDCMSMLSTGLPTA